MCLLDTLDGALMMTLYTSTALAKDQLAILYYSIVLTLITIVVAIVIGVLQLLSLILNVAEPTGKFWNGVESAGEHYDVIGKCLPPTPCSSALQSHVSEVVGKRNEMYGERRGEVEVEVLANVGRGGEGNRRRDMQLFHHLRCLERIAV